MPFEVWPGTSPSDSESDRELIRLSPLQEFPWNFAKAVFDRGQSVMMDSICGHFDWCEGGVRLGALGDEGFYL